MVQLVLTFTPSAYPVTPAAPVLSSHPSPLGKEGLLSQVIPPPFCNSTKLSTFPVDCLCGTAGTKGKAELVPEAPYMDLQGVILLPRAPRKDSPQLLCALARLPFCEDKSSVLPFP